MTAETDHHLLVSRTDTQYKCEMVCSMQQEQCDAAAIQQADYLNITSQCHTHIRKHTEEEVCLAMLKSVVLGDGQNTKNRAP